MKKNSIPEVASLTPEEVDTLMTLLLKLKQPKELGMVGRFLNIKETESSKILDEEPITAEEQESIDRVTELTAERLKNFGRPFDSMTEHDVMMAKGAIATWIQDNIMRFMFSGEDEKEFVPLLEGQLQYWKEQFQNIPEMMEFVTGIERDKETAFNALDKEEADSRLN